MNSIYDLIGAIDDIKDKITSGQYKELCDRARDIWSAQRKAQLDNFHRLFRSGAYTGYASDGSNYVQYEYGKLHGRCIIHGTEYWFRNGALHRKYDKPAIISADGSKTWCRDGVVHRDGDLPAVISSEGRFWFSRGLLHRDSDAPAAIFENGELQWYKDGLLHRSCGPAIIEPDGTESWYINGVYLPDRGEKPSC